MLGNAMSAVAEQQNVDIEYDSEEEGYAEWLRVMYGGGAARGGGGEEGDDDQQGELAEDDAGGQHARRVILEASSAGTERGGGKGKDPERPKPPKATTQGTEVVLAVPIGEDVKD